MHNFWALKLVTICYSGNFENNKLPIKIVIGIIKLIKSTNNCGIYFKERNDKKYIFQVVATNLFVARFYFLGILFRCVRSYQDKAHFNGGSWIWITLYIMLICLSYPLESPWHSESILAVLFILSYKVDRILFYQCFRLPSPYVFVPDCGCISVLLWKYLDSGLQQVSAFNLYLPLSFNIRRKKLQSFSRILHKILFNIRGVLWI